MRIILGLIQAGYRSHLHGRPRIRQIPSSEWKYSETQNLPCKTEQRWNKESASDDVETWEEISTLSIMHTGVKKKIKLITKYPKWQGSKHQDQILLDLLPLPSEQLLVRVENLIEWDQLCYFSLKSADGTYAYK